MSDWVVLSHYASSLEADIAVAQLHSSGISAYARGNDIVGIFGPGFQGTTARGVDVMVPSSSLADARDILGLSDDSA